MVVFYCLATIVIALGLISLRGGLRFAAYVRRESTREFPDFAPFASIIAPFRGIEEGLRENIVALFQQAYPSYEIIFVTDRADDQALALVEEVRKEKTSQIIPCQILVAGPATDSGQKVHNLIAAAGRLDPRSEIIVFVDTDARPHRDWIKALVAPLVAEEVGASSGYRWFVPIGRGFATHLRSVWNASITSALGERADKNFCWGGSTAIRRKTFDKLEIIKRWRGTVSDDFVITRTLQAAGLPIHFTPRCIIPSLDSCTFSVLREFSNRQLKITRVYAPHLWRPVLLGSLLFCVVFFGGLVLVAARAMIGLSYIAPLILLLAVFLLGSAKSLIRLRAVASVMPSHAKLLKQSALAHLLLWPFASALYLSNAIAALLSRRITWRGITYELKSPSEAVIISRHPGKR
jgi:cellulose synthase/poly-beta-1,6-N-acetylglucosamine synthase-like glycosyltransferase